MENSTDTQSVPAVRVRRRPLKSLWRAVRKPLARSAAARWAFVNVLAFLVRFIGWTNPFVRDISKSVEMFNNNAPAILALWHGQHLLVPILAGKTAPMVALFSRSPDAELNARVAEKLGIGTVRGSGGRESGKNVEKGGARALIELKRVLKSGRSIAMIADIPKGTPREAGLGIVMLAKISGRPIIPGALATSRRKVLEKTWDKTTINLPFGRASGVAGEPIFVDSDADADELERKRLEVTRALNAATAEAYRQVDEPK